MTAFGSTNQHLQDYRQTKADICLAEYFRMLRKRSTYIEEINAAENVLYEASVDFHTLVPFTEIGDMGNVVGALMALHYELSQPVEDRLSVKCRAEKLLRINSAMLGLMQDV